MVVVVIGSMTEVVREQKFCIYFIISPLEIISTNLKLTNFNRHQGMVGL